MRVLSIAAIATLFATSALAAATETVEEELASWYYVPQSLTYGGYETDGLSFSADCEDKQLHVAVFTNAQPEQNGKALRIQLASGPLRLTIPARLEVSDMDAYAVGDVKSRARFYALFHTGKPITVKVTGADPQTRSLCSFCSFCSSHSETPTPVPADLKRFARWRAEQVNKKRGSTPRLFSPIVA